MIAGWVVTYGTNEEELERRLRAKYGKEISQVEEKQQQMSDFYMATIKNPGSNEEQERRLQQVLRGGRGDLKKPHDSIDRKYYGTEEGKEKQQQYAADMAAHQEEERKKLKRIRKKLKELKKRREAGEDVGDSDDDGGEAEEAAARTRQIVAATGAVALTAAAAAAAADSGESKPFYKKIVRKKKKDKKSAQEEAPQADKSAPSVEMKQVLTLTAVAGTAALIGFVLGGSRR